MPAGCDCCSALASEMLLVSQAVAACPHSTEPSSSAALMAATGGDVEECIGDLYARMVPASPAPGCDDCALMRAGIDIIIHQALCDHPPHPPRPDSSQQPPPTALPGAYGAAVWLTAPTVTVIHNLAAASLLRLVADGKALWATEILCTDGRRETHTSTKSSQSLPIPAAALPQDLRFVCGLIATTDVPMVGADVDPFAWDDDPAVAMVAAGEWITRSTPAPTQVLPS